MQTSHENNAIAGLPPCQIYALGVYLVLAIHLSKYPFSVYKPWAYFQKNTVPSHPEFHLQKRQQAVTGEISSTKKKNHGITSYHIIFQVTFVVHFNCLSFNQGLKSSCTTIYSIQNIHFRLVTQFYS